MNKTLQTALGIAGLVVATQAAAQVTFYEREDFSGRSFTADRPIGNLERSGFNDRASSARVDGGAWQVCENARFNGNCVVLQPGQYDSLRAMGLNNQISSVRPVDNYSRNDRPGCAALRRAGLRRATMRRASWTMAPTIAATRIARTKRRSPPCMPWSARPSSVAGSSGRTSCRTTTTCRVRSSAA